MSMKKWQESVNEKAEVEKQNASILAAIKNNKIKEELGLLSGEKLFKPITSRLDTIQEGAPKEEKEEVPDYGMDEFDLINPFDGDFNPDAETPTPTPTSSPTPSPTSTPPSPTSTPPSPTWGEPQTPESTPLPPLTEEEEEELEESGSKPEEKPSKWGPPKPPGIEGSESVDLQVLSSMLTKNKDNPNYVVKKKTSKFHGYTMADIKKARDEILDRRKRGIKSRPADWIPPPPDEDELEREMEGSGTVDPNVLVEKLHLSLASIRAGNTSLKLKKQVESMLGLLKMAGEITQKDVHNILKSII